jgi:tellurite resistance protein TerC
MSFKKALAWSLFWIGLSMLTALGIAYWRGSEDAGLFLTGYALEKALSIDNLFVFLMVFSHFNVSREAQRRVLNWGILGVMLLRGILIYAGIELVERFEWIMYVFGVIVIYTGFSMLFGKAEEEFDAESNRTIRFVSRLFRVSKAYDGHRFFTREAGKLIVTPLFVVLIVIELTDVIFAVDSIPAVFSVTRDHFLVYSSNMLAVMGLRSLYFLLERMQSSFHYVKRGVGIILWFIGVKMLLPAVWHGAEISNTISLTVILSILFLSVVLSVAMTRSTRAPR